MRGRSVAAFVTVVLLILGALTIPITPARGLGTNSAPTMATGSITVRATANYGYSPDRIQNVSTNAVITVTFLDDDPSGMQHSLNISSREGFVIPTTYTAAQMDHLFGTYPTLYSTIVNYTGAQSVGTFQSPPTPGWYEFICNVSGHFALGMYGFIAFGENLPSNLTSPSRTDLGGMNVSTLGIVFVGVFLVAFAVVYLVWHRRRTVRKMTPQPVGRPKTGSTRTGDGNGRDKGSG
ncbi:MAG: hypothetical protein ABSB97_05345 [Thermoplasmata archaeon]|jgi:hypothetical protein